MDRLTPGHDPDQLPWAGELSLLDLIPLEDLQQLQDALAEFHGVASVITDPDGNTLTMPSNDMSICQLIRQSPKGAMDCTAIHQSLAVRIRHTREVICQPCEILGILKAVVPIFINNNHLANWWISQYGAIAIHEDQLKTYARRIGMEVDVLVREFKKLPQGDDEDFRKMVGWISSLIQRIMHMGFKNFMLSHDLSKFTHLESELDEHRSHLEDLVQERTAELIKANNCLQLEVLERNLAEEQAARQSKTLDAINQILQQSLADRSDRILAHTFLNAACELTASSFGFVVELKDGFWQMVASYQTGLSGLDRKLTLHPHAFAMGGIWRQLVETGDPISVPVAEDQPLWRPLPKGWPEIKSLLAVPLRKDLQVTGFIALANNKEGYALIDQNDVQSLAHAFIESLLRKRVEKAKTKSERRLSLALESANEGLWDYSPHSGYIYYSPRWFDMLGYNADEYPNTMETWRTLSHPDELPLLERTLKSLSGGNEEELNIEIRMLSSTGQWRWIQVRGRVVEKDANGVAARIVGTLIDISKYKQVEMALQKANNELQRLAALDDLTQIANRRRFDDRLAQEWRRAQRERISLALIICDIDFFKDYNDTYGHLKGDDTLYTVAQAINTTLKRPMDLVARYGGEEFAVILPSTAINGAKRVANEIKEAIKTLGIEHKSSKVCPYITLSFGVAAIVPTKDLTAKILVEKADQALYRAKAQGRDRIVQMDTGSDDSADEGDEGTDD